MEQLKFDLDNTRYYICSTCKSCLNACKVYCITNNNNLYCNRYKPIKEGK
ncbi:MAG: hypothetical protein ACRDD7_17590 [Peptostreptococcaceae bacterium]